MLIFLIFPTLGPILGSAISAGRSIAGEIVWNGFAEVDSSAKFGRLAFKIDPTAKYEFTNDGQSFRLVLPGQFVPLAVKQDSPELFEDPRLDKLKVEEIPGGIAIVGHWKFPPGPQRPAAPYMEAYDYRDRSSHKLVVDFWPREGLTVQQESDKKKIRSLEAKKKSETVALAHRLAEREKDKKSRESQNDVRDFCAKPLDEKTDLFLQFTPVIEKFPFERWISTTIPDRDFTYLQPTGEDEEADHVRLALSLNKQGKPALALRTLEFLYHKYPETPYRLEMEFLRANMLIRLGQGEQGAILLEEIAKNGPQTGVGFQSILFLALKKLRASQWLSALGMFQNLEEKFAQHRLSWLFRFGAAECLAAIGQIENAAKKYEWVIENVAESGLQAQAAFRIGDLYFGRGQYDQSLAAYARAIKYYPKEAQIAPWVMANRAECLYQLAQYQESEAAYKLLLREYPNHPFSWRATFRLGEIYGRNEKRELSGESRKWFYETINRFPFSPGSTLARIRLMSCGDRGGFDRTAREVFLRTEAENFSGGQQIAMARYPGLLGLERARAATSDGDPERAIFEIATQIRKSFHDPEKSELNRLYRITLRMAVQALLQNDHPFEALLMYRKMSSLVPRSFAMEPATPVEVDYLLKLARAASDQGLGLMSLEITGEINRPAVIAPQLDEDLKKAESAFTKAKALWLSDRVKQREDIKKLLADISDTSRFAFEREMMLGVLAQESGQLERALVHAVRADLLCADGDLRIKNWIYNLQIAKNDPQAALVLLKDLEARIRLQGTGPIAEGRESSSTSKAGSYERVTGLLGLQPLPSLMSVRLMQADWLEKASRFAEAAQLYHRISEDLEKGGGPNPETTLERVRYFEARAWLSSSDREARSKAGDLLRKITNSTDGSGFWKKLAAEKLKSMEG